MQTTALQRLLAERNVSPKFRALVEFLADASRTTNPTILSLSVTSDGFLIARTGGSNSRDTSGGAMIGSAENWRDNLKTICASYYPAVASAIRAKLRGCDYWNQW